MNDQKLSWFVWLEVTINHLAMSMKSYILIIFTGLFLQVIGALLMLSIGFMHFQNQSFVFLVLKLYIAEFPSILFGNQAPKVLLRNYAEASINSVTNDLFSMFIYTSPILILTIIFAQKMIKSKTDNYGKSQFIRGSQIVDAEVLKKKIKEDNNFTLGEIPLPKSVETSHMMVIGSAGSGKTQLLKKNIKTAVENLRFKNIIHDIKGDWTSELYDASRGDKIFNPMDSRTLKWTIFNDIHDIMDLKNVCLWLIPDLPGKDPFWQNSARMILESILLYMYQNEQTSNVELKYILGLPAEDLGKKLEGYGKGAEFAEKKDSFLTLQAQMAFIDFLDDGNFSIRKWINSENGGTIFLLNSEKTDAIMRPVLSLFVNFTASEILSLEDNLERRIYFWLDEFTALQKLQKVIDLLRLGRSKGAAVWLAYQDFQQLEKIYSREDMRTVINNTASIAVLQLKEPAAAKFFADRFGKQEYKIKSSTTSMGVSNNRDGISLADQIRDDYIVKDSEILNLPSLQAFVMIKDIDVIAKTKIPITKLLTPNTPFMPKMMTKEQQIELLKRQQAATMTEVLVAGDEKEKESGFTLENSSKSAKQTEQSDFENIEF